MKAISVFLKLELKNTVNLPLLIPLSRHLLIPSNTSGLHYTLTLVAVVSNKHSDSIKSSFPKVHRLILKMKQSILKIWMLSCSRVLCLALPRSCSQRSDILCAQLCIKPIMKSYYPVQSQQKKANRSHKSRQKKDDWRTSSQWGNTD